MDVVGCCARKGSTVVRPVVSCCGPDGSREGEKEIGTGRISLASALGSGLLKFGEEEERPAL